MKPLIFLPVAIFLMALAAPYIFPFFGHLEHKSYDLKMSLLKEQEISPKILNIAIDDFSRDTQKGTFRTEVFMWSFSK